MIQYSTVFHFYSGKNTVIFYNEPMRRDTNLNFCKPCDCQQKRGFGIESDAGRHVGAEQANFRKGPNEIKYAARSTCWMGCELCEIAAEQPNARCSGQLAPLFLELLPWPRRSLSIMTILDSTHRKKR